MTRSEAKQIVEDMLLVCQKLKSNLAESPMRDWADAYEVPVEKLQADLYGWLYPPKDITPTLVDLAMGKKAITGLTVYNLMAIAHRHCPAISLLAPFRLPEGRDLPEPDISWCAERWDEEN